MQIHFIIFVGMEISFLLVSACPLCRRRERAVLAAPTEREGLSTSGCNASGDRVEGRVGNLVGFNLKSSLNHFRQGLLYLRICSAVIRFRVFFLIPQTDCHCFRSTGGDERDFVLEAFLFSKQGSDFPVDRVGKLPNAVRLQMQGNMSSKHGNLLWLSSKRCDYR